MTDEIIFKKSQNERDLYRIECMVNDQHETCLIKLKRIVAGEVYYGAIPFSELKDAGFKDGDTINLTWDRKPATGETVTYTSPDDFMPYILIKKMSGCSPNVVHLEGWKNYTNPKHDLNRV